MSRAPATLPGDVAGAGTSRLRKQPDMDPAVSAALTESDPDARFSGIPTTALRQELRRRKLASRSRDVRANPGNINGTYKTPGERATAIRRQVLAYGRRIGTDADADALAGLTDLHAAVEEAAGIACRALVQAGSYSWAEVAARLGLGRQAAWDRYHAGDGTRRKRGTQLRNER